MASSSGLPSLTFSTRGFKGLKGSSSNNTGGFNSTSSSNFGFSGGTSKDFGFKSFRFKAPRPPKGPTAQQALERLYIQQHQHPHRGLLGSILHDAGHVVEKGLDYISRPSYAIASGVYDATKGKGFNWGQFAHGLKTGIEGKTKTGFGQVLQEHGILKGHGILRGLMGFGLDVTTDPVLLASLGTGAGEAEIAAREAEMGLAKGTLRRAAAAAAKGTFKTSAEAKAAADTLKAAGAGFEARSALAATHAKYMKALEGGNIDKAFGKVLSDNIRGLQGAAHMEAANAGARMLRAQFKVPFGPLLSHELPIKAPGLQRVADMQGILGKLPGLPKAAETIGKAFKPGWRNEKMHALEIVSKHIKNVRQEEMAAIARRTLKPSADALTPEQIDHALRWGETNPGIVKMRPGRATRTLNLTMLKKAVTDGSLSQPQADFIKAWHSTTESMRKADKEYGVKYDKPLMGGAKDNILYVPQVRVAATGEKFTKGASVLAKRGFQFPRGGSSTMALIDHIRQTDPQLAKELVTNPLDLLAIRAQSGAAKQADTWMTNLVMSTFGHPTMVADTARQSQLLARRSALEAKLHSLKTLDPVDLAELHKNALIATEAERNKAVLRAGIRHFVETASKRKELTSLKGQLTKAEKRQVPTAHQFIHMSDLKVAPFLKAWSKGTTAKTISKAIRVSRGTHKSLNALERQVVGSVRKAGELAPSTGMSVHGSQFKALVADLLDKTAGILPKEKVAGLREVHQLARFKRGESWQQRHMNLVESLLGEIKHARQGNQAQLEAVLAKHLPNATKRTTLASTIASKQAALDRHIANWDQIEQAITAKHMVKLQNRTSAIEDRMPVELRIGTRLRAAIDKTDRQLQNAKVKNPAAFQPGYKVVEGLKHANGSDVALPTQMAETITRVNDSLNSENFAREFHNVLQKNIARWKVGATVVNPGYAFRNATSILWNSYISPKGGMPLWAWGKYGPQAARLLKDIAVAKAKNPKDLTMADRIALKQNGDLAAHGIYMGLFGGDVNRVRAALQGNETAKEALKGGHAIKAYTRTMTTANIQRENWERLTHFLYRTEGQKLSRGEAAQIVRDAHFDYGDLTKTEESIRRSLIPFYTWTRRNIPYQLSAAVMRPGKYAAFPLLRNESNFASGSTPGQIEPDFIKNALGFHVPFGGKGNFYLPRIGPEDLMIPEHPIERGSSLLSPLASIPIELLTNKKLGTGAPIYGTATSHPRSPISGIAADILRGIPGTNVGQTARTVNGKVVRGPGANPLVGYFAQQLPLTNLVVNQQAKVKQAQRGGSGKGLLSEVLGVSTYKPDQGQLQAGANAVEQQGFKQYIKGLRDMGVIPEPKKTKQSPFAKRNSRLTNQAFGGQ